ncbi:hypothetical protein FA13DRAFT_254325 [Coprinellus micaceus]|uniref:Yeast cell wall synthesis Kre9/Knh1-like N-terminal domain-containing protein n=1 Tax=Coprinellus micaceus TaxID=71717 RepID=A0A4Y7TE52_COPMI|nr:hypothetical protein FA13DRAFT_254325 [Coprinellus micaceus]
MFSKLALLALITPLISALTLHIPAEVRSQQTVTITWDTAPTDPPQFTIQLVNEAFNDQFAIRNNVDPNLGSVTITLPVVPVRFVPSLPGFSGSSCSRNPMLNRGGYTLRAVNVGNINDVYSETGTFSVLELSTTFTPSSTASTSSGTGTTSSRATTSGTGSTTSTVSRSTTSASSTTSQSSTTSATTTGTGTSPAATALSGNNADSLKFNAGVAVAALAAGVAAFAL